MTLTAYQLDMRSTRLLRLADGRRTYEDLQQLLDMTRAELDAEIARLRHLGCAVHVAPKPHSRGRWPGDGQLAKRRMKAG